MPEKVEITVHIPLKEKGNESVYNLEGLPVDEDASTVKIDIPFSSLNHTNEAGEVDVNGLVDKMDVTLSLLMPKNHLKGGLENQSNCGGYPVGTTLTVTKHYACLGTVSNTYECMSINGSNNWYITSSTFSGISDCLGDI